MAAADTTPLWLEVEIVGGIAVLRPRRSLILQGDVAEEVADYMTRLVNRGNPPRLVLNCLNVTMVSSLMLGKLVVLARKARSARGQLAICSASPAVESVFTVTRLVQVMPLYADETSAVHALGGNGRPPGRSL